MASTSLAALTKRSALPDRPPPTRVVLLQFADMDALKAFEDKEQKTIAEFGSKLASFRIIGIEGVEQKSENDKGDGPHWRSGPSATTMKCRGIFV